MNVYKQGYLLLGADLEDGIHPMSTAQLRRLRNLIATLPPPENPDLPASALSLMAMGLPAQVAEQVALRLARAPELSAYLHAAKSRGIVPLTLADDEYPDAWRQAFGMDAPPVFFARGDLSLLQRPCIAVVGSRDIGDAQRAFAAAIGRMAAEEGYVLVSGHARGADSAAENACWEAGGAVISILPAEMPRLPQPERWLCLCAEGMRVGFSSVRALTRNHYIYALADKTFVAQVRRPGGTWAGSLDAIQKGYCPVFAYDDGSKAVRQLEELGATLLHGLPSTLHELLPGQISLFDEKSLP